MEVKNILVICVYFLIVFINVTADVISESKYVMKINRTNSENNISVKSNNTENGNYVFIYIIYFLD